MKVLYQTNREFILVEPHGDGALVDVSITDDCATQWKITGSPFPTKDVKQFIEQRWPSARELFDIGSATVIVVRERPEAEPRVFLPWEANAWWRDGASTLTAVPLPLECIESGWRKSSAVEKLFALYINSVRTNSRT